MNAEAADKRPKVRVRAEGEAAVLVLTCVIEQLEETYPDYKWLPDYSEGGAPTDQPTLRVLARSASTTYVGSRSRKETKLISGMQVALVGDHLDKALATTFAEPVASEHDVRAPSEIRPALAGTAEAEAIKVGVKQIGSLRETLCADLKKQIAAK